MGLLLLEQDPPHLGTVAVGDHDLPAGLGDVGHDLRGDPGGTPHTFRRFLLALLEQRVPSQGDDHSVHMR